MVVLLLKNKTPANAKGKKISESTPGQLPDVTLCTSMPTGQVACAVLMKRAVMKPGTIRELRDKTPFRRFFIHLADGRSIPVVTPDHLMISPLNDEFAVYLSDGSLEIVDGKLVTGITRKSKGRSGS